MGKTPKNYVLFNFRLQTFLSITDSFQKYMKHTFMSNKLLKVMQIALFIISLSSLMSVIDLLSWYLIRVTYELTMFKFDLPWELT